MKGMETYRKGVVTIEIWLPLEHAVCRYCPMLEYESPYRRFTCFAGERDAWLFSPGDSRPDWCPAEWTQGVQEGFQSGIVRIKVSLPADYPVCQYCRLIGHRGPFRDCTCRGIKEKNWLFCPGSGIPEWCPVKWECKEETECQQL